MRKLLLLAIVVITALSLDAQTVHKDRYVAFSVQPLYTWRVLKVDKNQPLADSLNSIEHPRLGYSASVQFNRQLNREWTIQIGLQYTNTGFTRTRENVKHLDKIHPDIPKIDQQIETYPGYSADFNYVFHYVDILFLANRKLQMKSKKWELFLTSGASLNFLVKDDVAVRLKGFTIDGKRAFSVNSYLQPRFMNVTGHFGFRANYKHTEKLGYYIQPLLSVPALPATSGQLSYRLIYAGIHLGAYINIDIKGSGEEISK